jgi:hypothetical protein
MHARYGCTCARAIRVTGVRDLPQQIFPSKGSAACLPGLDGHYGTRFKDAM